MSSKKYEKLENPPIKQVILGLELNGLFSSNENLDVFNNNFGLKDYYYNPKKFDLYTVNFIDKPEISQNTLEGIEYKSKDGCQFIHMEANRLIYSDSNKYKDFESFYSKFCLVLNEIIKEFTGDVEVLGIHLRYINDFSLGIDKIQEKFRILPTINCINENENFAKIKNHISIYNLVADSNINMEANVKTVLRLLEKDKLNVIFDIDTYYKDNFKLSDTQKLGNLIQELKEFKNDIFFNNFTNITKIEEFN